MWDYERPRLWGKIIVVLAAVMIIVSIPIAAARQTTYEWRCATYFEGYCEFWHSVPVDVPSPIVGAGYLLAFIGLVLGVAGFTAYIYYDLKMKTAPHAWTLYPPPP